MQNDHNTLKFMHTKCFRFFFFKKKKPISELDLLHFRDSIYIILLPSAYKDTLTVQYSTVKHKKAQKKTCPCHAINLTDELQFGTHLTEYRSLCIVFLLYICVCVCVFA